MNRSAHRNKQQQSQQQQQKSTSRSKSRPVQSKGKVVSTQSQPQQSQKSSQQQTQKQASKYKNEKNEKLFINRNKGINIGKRTGQQIKKKETGLNYDGTEKLADYFEKQKGLLIESDQKIVLDKSDVVEAQVSRISDSQDDSQILNLINKRNSLDFNLSSEQSISDIKSRRRSSEGTNKSGRLVKKDNQEDGENKNDNNKAGQMEYETIQKQNKRKSDERRESSLGLKSFTGNILEIPSARSRKTSSFRMQRSQNRNSIALSSIPRVSRFSGRMMDNQSDIGSDRMDDIELLGQISNLPPDLIVQNLQKSSNSLMDTPFTKHYDDFEITLSDSDVSQINQEFSYVKHNNKRKSMAGIQKQNQMQNEDQDELELAELLEKNKQIRNEMSQRKKLNTSNSFHSCLLDVSDSRIYNKSGRTNTAMHDFGKISPIQEVNTQQSNKKEDIIHEKNKAEITIEPSEYFLENQSISRVQQTDKNNKAKEQQDLDNEEQLEVKILSQIKENKQASDKNKEQSEDQNAKKLSQNIVQENQENPGQNFIYTKVRRNNNAGKKVSNEMVNENENENENQEQEENEIIIISKKLSPLKAKQLKKYRQSLDTSDIPLQVYDLNSQNDNRPRNSIQKQQQQEEDEEEVLHKKNQLINDYIKQKRNSTDINLQGTLESANKLNQRKSNQLQSPLQQQEDNRKMIEENVFPPTFKLESNQKYVPSDHDYNNFNNNEEIEVGDQNYNYQNDQGEQHSSISSRDNYQIEIITNQRKSLSNKKMDVESEGVPAYSSRDDDDDEKVEESPKVATKRGRPKRKRITPEKHRQDSQSVSISSQHSLSTGSNNSSQYDEDSKQIKKTKKTSKSNSISSQSSTSSKSLKKLKQINKKHQSREQLIDQYQEIYGKGFHKDQIEITVDNEGQSFGNGRYPVRKRIRPLLSWRETAVYGSEGLLYIITDKDSEDLTYVNYTIPGFSNVPQHRPQKKENKKVQQRNSSLSEMRKLEEIKEEEGDETDVLKNNDSQKYDKADKESVSTNKITNRQSGQSNKSTASNRDTIKLVQNKKNNLNSSQEEEEEEEIQTEKPIKRNSSTDKQNNKKRNSSDRQNNNKRNSIERQNNNNNKSNDRSNNKSNSQDRQNNNKNNTNKQIKNQDKVQKVNSKSPPPPRQNVNQSAKPNTTQQPKQNKSEKEVKKNNRKSQKNKMNSSLDTLSEESFNEDIQMYQAELNEKVEQKKPKQQNQDKSNKLKIDQSDLINEILNVKDLSKFNPKITEQSSDILKFTVTLLPGSEISNDCSKYRLEIKVVECAWKKLLICIEDSTNYLKQDDKKIIKKDQSFSIKYKERENSKSSTISITLFKNYTSSKATKI